MQSLRRRPNEEYIPQPSPRSTKPAGDAGDELLGALTRDGDSPALRLQADLHRRLGGIADTVSDSTKYDSRLRIAIILGLSGLCWVAIAGTALALF